MTTEINAVRGVTSAVKFTEVLRRLRFDEDVLALVRQAILESHRDEKQTHQEAQVRLRKEYDRLQR